MSRLKVVSVLLLAVMVLSLVACGATEAPEATEAPAAPTEKAEAPTEAPQVTQSDLVIGMAVHAPPAEALFWGVVEKGAKDAAAALGVELKSGGSRDPAEQSALIEDYVASGADGIMVSLANPDAMKDSIKKATDAGIPVITMNSGVNVYKEYGALTHVGQTEFIAGQGAGEQFSKMGYTKALCIIHEEANIALEERCDGLADTFTGEVERFNIASTGIEDPAGSLATIQDKLTADPSFDSVLTLSLIHI